MTVAKVTVPKHKCDACGTGRGVRGPYTISAGADTMVLWLCAADSAPIRELMELGLKGPRKLSPNGQRKSAATHQVIPID